MTETNKEQINQYRKQTSKIKPTNHQMLPPARSKTKHLRSAQTNKPNIFGAVLPVFPFDDKTN